MHLKSLTLKGFKSFASATTLRFEPGITCVVGPNGSGKSNVVDALSWVMGEQGAKSLRGGKMEDVIFAGTTGRVALGRAEVTLTIDNADGALPIDYSEVSITRRMFRDGAGEYEINGSGCRLMDVQELLSDSGIGREMHVIVGQGRLSAILESRPEDRRSFIEEAAGVLKHRKRKDKAVRKLESMQANVNRLTDLTTELRRRLEPLGRQAEAARRAQRVQAELRDARLRLAADDLVTRRSELAGQQSREAFAREQQITVQAELDAAHAALAQQEYELGRVAPVVEAASQAWFQLSALVERVNATVVIATERARHLDTQVHHDSGRDPDRLDAEADGVEKEEAQLIAAVEAASEVLADVRERLDAAEHHAKAAERTHLAVVRAAADRREGLARLSGQVEGLRLRVQTADNDVDRIGVALERARVKGERIQAEFDATQQEVAGLEDDKSGCDSGYERAATALALLDNRVEQLRAAERDAGTLVASLQARIEALSMNSAVADGGAWLLDQGYSGLMGSLAESITVRSGYETAIAAVLGVLADAVVANSGASATAALTALKSGDAGRAGIVFAGPSTPDPPSSALPPTVCRAVDVVDCTELVRGGLHVLLSDVAVVDDVTAALALVTTRPRVRAVTRDGDLVGSGWMNGGSGRDTSRLEMRAAVVTATAELMQARESAEGLAAALSEALGEQADCKATVDEVSAARHEAGRRLAVIGERLGRLADANRAADEERNELHRRREAAEDVRKQAVASLRELEDRLCSAEHQADVDGGMDPDADEAVRRREQAVAELARVRSVEMEARLALRAAEQRADSIRGRADSLRRAARAEYEARARAEQVQRSRKRAAEVAVVVAELGEQLAGHTRQAVEQARRRRDESTARRTELTQRIEEIKERTRALSAQLNQLTDAVHRDEVAKAQAELRSRQLEQTIAEQFGIGVDDLIAEYGPDISLPPTELEMIEYEQAVARGEQVSKPAPMPYHRETQLRRAKAAEGDLATLGRVNPLALEEFAALEERYNFLSTQLEDVRKARKALLDVVAEVDARILQVFADAYEDVAREFVEVFTTLFPGGEGRLRLTNPHDMLTTGVEVEARPPGKKVKRLSLLSGGEKSLTAVALLVAIFRARPSPFYVMDEVEAALDDTNLRRLISLFEQLREKSQLIVITHQKPTMEVADALYGVSMRGDGITAVISQRLRGENLAPPADRTPLLQTQI